jgi:nucleotide-binding universal stress UspA family protein
MEKHFLICTDGSPESKAAVQYVGFAFGKNARFKIDLLHILPDVPPLFLEPGENMAEMVQLQGFAEQVEKENRHRAGLIMGEAKKILTDAGIDPENIRPLIREPSVRVAQEILDLEEAGGYDTVFMGRHGMSAFAEFFMGSVTNKVLQHAKGVPVCVAHGKIDSRKLLVPVVSAPNSKRVLEQAAWLLAASQPMEVTILHVVVPLVVQGMTAVWPGMADVESVAEGRILSDAEDMLDQAKRYLMEQGVPQFAITTRIEKGASAVARAILKEARDRGYGSIMVGRRGISRARRFLFGSVSHNVVQQARNMAVWVIS